MAIFSIGDLVVLKSGSMRMVVEGVENDVVATVWCNEGVIGRDNFSVALLNKWEHREDSGHRGPPRGGDRDGGGYKGRGGGDRDGGGGGYRGKRDDDRGGYKGNRDRDGDDRPPRKTGWDGKPREKKYFRKDD